MMCYCSLLVFKSLPSVSMLLAYLISGKHENPILEIVLRICTVAASRTFYSRGSLNIEKMSKSYHGWSREGLTIPSSDSEGTVLSRRSKMEHIVRHVLNGHVIYAMGVDQTQSKCWIAPIYQLSKRILPFLEGPDQDSRP